jgi:hypothetical protein
MPGFGLPVYKERSRVKPKYLTFFTQRIGRSNSLMGGGRDLFERLQKTATLLSVLTLGPRGELWPFLLVDNP